MAASFFFRIVIAKRGKLKRINCKIETTRQESENRKNRRVVKRNSRIEIIVQVESELNYGFQPLLHFLLFSDLALIAPFCQTTQAS